MPVAPCAGGLQAGISSDTGAWGSCKGSLPFAPIAVHKKGSDLTEQICNTYKLHPSIKERSAA